MVNWGLKAFARAGVAAAAGRPLMRRFLAAVPYLGLAVLGLQLALWYPIHARREIVHGLDFPIYYDAVQRVLHGRPLYDGWFLYPPTFVAMTCWATFLRLETFQALWYLILLGAYWMYAWALARLAFEKPTWRHVCGAGLVLVLTPGCARPMSTGNADVIVWALTGWGILLCNRYALLASTVMKLYTGPALAVMIWRRRDFWTPLLLLPILALSVAIVGLRPFQDWIASGGAPIPPLLLHDPDNIGLPMLIVRLLGLVYTSDAAERVILTVVPVVALAVTIVGTWRWSLRLQLVAIVLVSVWTSPVCWTFRIPLLLLGVAVWHHRRRGTPPTPARRERSGSATATPSGRQAW